MARHSNGILINIKTFTDVYCLVEPNYFARRLGLSTVGGCIVSLLFNAIYVISLILLFANLYIQRYLNRNAKVKSD